MILANWWSFWEKPLQGIIQWGAIALLILVGTQLKPFLTKTIAEKKQTIKKILFWISFAISEIALLWSILVCGAVIAAYRHRPLPSRLYDPSLQWLFLGVALLLRLWNMYKVELISRRNRWGEVWSKLSDLKQHVDFLERINAYLQAKQPLPADELTKVAAINMARDLQVTQGTLVITEPKGSKMLVFQSAATIISYWIAFYFILLTP